MRGVRSIKRRCIGSGDRSGRDSYAAEQPRAQRRAVADHPNARLMGTHGFHETHMIFSLLQVISDIPGSANDSQSIMSDRARAKKKSLPRRSSRIKVAISHIEILIEIIALF